MKARVFRILDSLRTSFWFVPLLMAIGALLLVVLALDLDEHGPSVLDVVLDPYLRGGPDDAARLLGVIAASMITTTGVVFSVTIVVLSLASQQFGPRILRGFMRDRGNQMVLGTFIATFLYCLLALMNVGREADQVPHLTVALAVVLALLSLAVLIFFIHHVAVSIQAEYVVMGVYKVLVRSIERNYPGPKSADAKPRPHPDTHVPDGPGAMVGALKSGYVDQVDHGSLIAAAADADVVVKVLHRPGKYVVAGRPLFEVWPAKGLTDDLAGRLGEMVAIGASRTDDQDPEFLIDQLVEIGVRSLSTGINDPFTASACIDRIGSALALMADRDIPSPLHFQDGHLRLIAGQSDYDGLVKAALTRLRQHGAGSAGVTVRLLEATATAAAGTQDPDRRLVLLKHADRMLRSARAAGHDPDDLADMEQRYADVVGVAAPA